MIRLLSQHWPYMLTITLLVIGLWGMMAKENYLKKLIGMNVFQGAIILFFIERAFKWGASVPIYDEKLGTAIDNYINPIPHGLMLTAIVVSVATTGVGLALLVRIYREYHTINERELLQRMRGGKR